ncbi:hypothetical protein D3C72_2466100 [compost metagenome]
MGGDGRVAFSAEATHQNVRVRMVVGLGFGQLAPVHESLDIGVVAGAEHHARTLEMVDA